MIRQAMRKFLKPVIDESLGEIIAASAQTRENHFVSLERMRGMAITAGLRHLFNHSYFSICQLDATLAAAKIIPDGETMRILKPLHCIDWADMWPELRDEVFTRIMIMFGATGDILKSN